MTEITTPPTATDTSAPSAYPTFTGTPTPDGSVTPNTPAVAPAPTDQPAPTVKPPVAADPNKTTHVFEEPNLTDEQASNLAYNKALDFSLSEREVVVRMPGELLINTDSMIELSGTDTDFDQTYYVVEIERTLSWERGFVETLHLRNSSPGVTIEPLNAASDGGTAIPNPGITVPTLTDLPQEPIA